MWVPDRWFGRAVLPLVLAVLWGPLSVAPADAPAGAAVAAELDARRLIGKAHYENDQFDAAAAEFRRCIELQPDSALDYFNLGLILMRAQVYDDALAALHKAQDLDPALTAARYIEGIVHKREGRYDEAAAALRDVIARDPKCDGAYYNLGVCLKLMQKYEDAVAAFERKAELTPTDPSTHYQLITLFRRLGRVDDAERHKEIYDQVKDTVDESEKTAEALERSPYTYIIQAPRLTPGLEPDVSGAVQFVDVTAAWGLPAPGTHGPARRVLDTKNATQQSVRKHWAPLWGNAITLGDYDGDGDLDIYVVNCSDEPSDSANQLYRNDGPGKFTDVTAAAGVADTGLGFDAVFGDCDNDGDVDLYVVNCGPNVMYRNNGDGTFEDVSEAARVNEPQFGRRAVLFDYDHDNDLDIFVCNYIELPADDDKSVVTADGRPQEGTPGQSNTLLRNNGNGTFSDYTDAAGLLTDFAWTVDATAADFDGDSDIDLLVSHENRAPDLFLNARLGKFTTGGAFEPAVSSKLRLVEEDLSRDGMSDLLAADGRAYINAGAALFKALPIVGGADDARLVLDFNNDGWSDLLVGGRGAALTLRAGVGPERFRAVALDGDAYNHVAGAAAGDLDGDGDEDLVLQTLDRGPLILRNDGDRPHHWLTVRLVGKKSNRTGLGATVEIASGGHYQRKVYHTGPVHFGLGELSGVDVVRVTWPNGVAQNVVQPAIDGVLTIEEYVKVSASCGFLYVWNGQRFDLINEILGIGPLGAPMAPDVYFPLDDTELTKIDAGQLVVQDGLYELRLTEELREITYADQITLRVVDHPGDLELIPNERFDSPPPEDKNFAVREPLWPVSAVDDRGNDVRALLLKHDEQFPTFPLVEQYDGLSEPHSLTLDWGDLSGAEQVVLFLDAWIYWSEASVSMAIYQDPRYDVTPLKLEARAPDGQWQTVVESVGLPTSKGIVVPVELTGRLPRGTRQMRLSTTMRIYFDRIFIATADHAAQCRQTELPVMQADLRYRGFSRLERDEYGFERFDYAAASPYGSWDPPAGMLTRYGDVTPLLHGIDDMYVIFGPGDELRMLFDGRVLPPLPTGWTRDFVFFASGWVKDGDLNTKFSETVTPLPFHAMSGYPYPVDEHYPDTPAHRRYLDTYNTRSARSTVGRISDTGSCGWHESLRQPRAVNNHEGQQP